MFLFWIVFFLGLQTQPSINPPYAGPWDAVRKITGQHGTAGLFKGQTATFAREAIGYGAYFWAYESLMRWEMKRKNVSRDEIPATKTVLFGAAAGYAVCFSFLLSRGGLLINTFIIVVGLYIPHRCHQIQDANRRFHSRDRAQIQNYLGLC